MKYPRVLHYPGSKWSMANWIIDHMPAHQVYLEPYFGSGAVFFNKAPSQVETINDIDGDVINLFKVIRDSVDELAEKVHWTPHSREEYYSAYERTGDELEDARRFLVRTWQAIGAKTSDRTGWKSNIDPKNSHKTKEWNRLPERLLQVADRLKEVQIEHQEAAQVISRYRRDDVLIYADPPYILETRSRRLYRHEMKISDHVELLNILDDHPGPVILSGYAHPLYDERLKNWRMESIQASAEAGASRTEVIWINPAAAEQVGQQSLFSLPGMEVV